MTRHFVTIQKIAETQFKSFWALRDRLTSSQQKKLLETDQETPKT